MALHSLGLVTVAAAGTPVRCTDNESVTTARYACHSFLIEADPSNTGKIWVGSSALNKTTGAGLYAILPIPTDNILPSFSATIVNAPAGFNMADIYLDADINGEKALVSIIRA